MSRRKRIKKFTTLAALMRDWQAGTIETSDMEEIIRGVEMGIGLQKRDEALAAAMQGAPGAFEKDPLYVRGFNDGLMTGYAACREDVEKGTPLRPEEEEKPKASN